LELAANQRYFVVVGPVLAWIPIEGKLANISACSGLGLSENFSLLCN
jgi:hypothetical protein